ncbi:intraflagellar transport protein 27 homolog [Ischnura elegans]|uniref:intraflagellar transport protein 27 homolog n=1 Tax=Ischnura elegans TaxID=197161 RepID=UPI001ED87B7A|nr:intraflagellar transport protein 27 homolog [Ischnura elegans]
MYEIALFRVAVVGDEFVGKTSIVHALLSGGIQFSKNYVMTSDVVVNVKDIALPEFKDVVELLILDSAGNSLYEDYLPRFWKELDAAFIVFDLTSEKSYNSIDKWVDKVKNVQKTRVGKGTTNSSIPGVIFANKNDLLETRAVNPEIGRSLASQLGFGYFEGSAKNNNSIDEAFKYLAKELHNKFNSIFDENQAELHD